MPRISPLDRGRQAFERRRWSEAFDQLSAADKRAPLEPEDLELLATAAQLTGRDAESSEFRTRAHHGFLERGDPERAARCAFWLGMNLMQKGEMAQAGGWFARARGLIDDTMECVEQGYLLCPGALQALFSGDPTTAFELFVQAAKVAERFAEPDLMALTKLGRAQSLIALGESTQGIALLDEAMVGVTAGEVSPVVAGIVYCAMIEACQQAFDTKRAAEWTEALSRWVESQPDLVPFRGLCLVHRAEILQMHGAWHDALAEAQRARDRLSQPPDPAVGAAWFRLAELHRLRGEFDKAEESYREASRFGRTPQPGLALLRLAQGKIDAAAPAIRLLVEASHDVVSRAQVLPAYIEIMLETNDLDAARAACDELAGLAEQLGASLLQAIAAHWDGAILLVQGDVRRAIAPLRHALTAWQQIEAPYESARARVLLGLAHRELGDEDTARMELGAARATFDELGAAPIAARVTELLGGKQAAKTAGGLSAREREVLGLLAAGRTNRAIADALVISEKTVARHVSNIFTKLGVSSRAAATAYAYEHDLV